ncbi:hypothetical protein HOLleu_33481 [Holothuria leucospilota]|uniref:Ig-like domain-containing protein n=1 Tax=Holothuria leucospilota TaxID=206669 RepID=A0A9Q1BFG8_HOLLE|nr:hypothetical protein HOLleu_33481 [Holothuria leucospilota]
MRMDILADCNFPILVVFFLVVGGTGGTDSSARQELALLGESISLECRLEHFVAIVGWRKGAEFIFLHGNQIPDIFPSTQTMANMTSEINISQVTLTINYIHYKDSGQYFCWDYLERQIISVFNLLVYGVYRFSIMCKTLKLGLLS